MSNSFVGLPNDGSGKKLNTQTQVVEGTEVHNQVYTLGDPDKANFQHVDEYGAATVRFQGGGFDFDSFGKAKVSQETVLSSFVPEFDEEPKKFRLKQSGTSELVYVPNEKALRLKVDVTSGDSISRTSHRYHKYIPGITNTMLMTINPGAGKDNVTKRWGMYNEENGIFFAQIDGALALVIRTSTNGTPVDKVIPSDQWNGDRLDGTGLSKMLFDTSKANIFWVDFQWLGVGVVRWGVYQPNGSKILVHTEHNANRNSTVYMGSANLPVRWEIENTGDTASSSEMKVLNASVMMNAVRPEFEGSRFIMGKGINDDMIHLEDEWKILISARQCKEFKGKTNHSVAMVKYIHVFNTKNVVMMVQKGTPTDGNETWNTISDESTVEYSADAVKQGMGESLYTTLLTPGSHKVDIAEQFDYLSECLQQGPSELNYSILMRTVTAGEEDDVMVGMSWEELRMA